MVCGASLAWGGEMTGTRQSTRLYTAPDPSAGGGLHGTIANQTVRHIFAVRADDPTKVYQGAVAADSKAFSFAGLPVAKYDLLVVCPDRFYEGLTRTLEDNTLTPKDRASMKTAIEKSEPFFEIKEIYRLQGVSGEAGKARGVVQYVRARPILLQSATSLADARTDFQIRSIKVALLEDVNIGWQLLQTREIIRMEVTQQEVQGVLPHAYNPGLGGIRVTDTVKDLGAIQLLPDVPE